MKPFKGQLKLPAIAAPLFLVSGPDLVVETCKGGIVGTFPALNQRTTEGFSEWLDEIGTRLSNCPDAAPYGVNLIVNKSNKRLEADLAQVVAHKVPLVITSLGAVREVVDAVHSYGGIVFHDVINRRHAEKAAEANVDGIIAVAAGAGGHSGLMSPFALIEEIRQVFTGTIILGGAISTGSQILAAQCMGADFAYLGTRFVAVHESMALAGYKTMIVDSRAADIVYTPEVSGVNANFLRASMENAGFVSGQKTADGEKKVWKNIWSAGHGVGSVHDVPSAADICQRLIAEYGAAVDRVKKG